MNILRSLIILLLVLMVTLLLLIVVGAGRRVYNGNSSLTTVERVEKCVDLLVVTANFKLDELPNFLQGITIENGMSLIVQTNGSDDGIYIVLYSQLVRLLPLIGGDSYHVTSGTYRQTLYTVPRPEEYGKNFLIERGSSLRYDSESFIVIKEADEGETFPVVTTALTHVISIVNQSSHDIEFAVHGHLLEVKGNSKIRYLVSNDLAESI
jgi:hypothetical protein